MNSNYSILESSYSQKYYHYLLNLINDDNNIIDNYKKVLYLLYKTSFYSVHPMDENRITDGLELRRKYVSEHDNSAKRILFLPEYCSILEMMVALAVRCENDIMQNDSLGNRTSKWFWEMVKSLGLIEYPDDVFYDNPERFCEDTEKIVHTFLSREYYPNGKGGLFTVNEYPMDMKEVEIWCQLMWHLNEVIQSIGE